jgi:hypothetical protein
MNGVYHCQSVGGVQGGGGNEARGQGAEKAWATGGGGADKGQSQYLKYISTDDLKDIGESRNAV